MQACNRYSRNNQEDKEGADVITDGSAHPGDRGGLIANLLGDVAHTERVEKATSPGPRSDLSLIGLLAKMGLLSPVAFRLWCYVRPFLT